MEAKVTLRKIVQHLLLVTILETWALMIVLGMIAGYAAIPGLAIGFWAALAVRFLFRMAFVNVPMSVNPTKSLLKRG